MLLTTDLNTRIYPEIQSAIDRDDEGFAQTAVDFAEAMARGYLSRFNTATLFATRDAFLLGILKDIAVHEFCKLANIQMDLTFIENNYMKAQKLLSDIQKGAIVQDWPLQTVPEGASLQYQISSAPKRETRF